MALERHWRRKGFSCWYRCCTLEGGTDGSNLGGALPRHTPRTHNLSVTSQLLLGLVITSLGAQTQSVGCRPPSYSGAKSLCTPACLTTCALGTAHLCFTGLPLAFSDLEDRLWPRLPFKLLCHTVVFTHIFSREVWTPALGRELPFIVVLP